MDQTLSASVVLTSISAQNLVEANAFSFDSASVSYTKHSYIAPKLCQCQANCDALHECADYISASAPELESLIRLVLPTVRVF